MKKRLITILLLHLSTTYCMELSISHRNINDALLLIGEEMLKHIISRIEHKLDRSTLSHIKLLEFYQNNNNPKFNQEKLEELNAQLKKEIDTQLNSFEKQQSTDTKKFLTIVNNNNRFTDSQKELFDQLNKFYNASNNTTHNQVLRKQMFIYPITFLLLYFMYIQVINIIGS